MEKNKGIGSYQETKPNSFTDYWEATNEAQNKTVTDHNFYHMLAFIFN